MKVEEALLKQARRIIEEEVERAGYKVRKIFLFGSRARGDAREDSDWDFLVVVDRDMDLSQRIQVEAEVGLRLVLERLPSDVLIISAERFSQKMEDVGHIAYYAVKEGLEI